MIIVVRSGLTSDLALSHDVQIDVIVGFGAHLSCRHAYLNVCAGKEEGEQHDEEEVQFAK